MIKNLWCALTWLLSSCSRGEDRTRRHRPRRRDSRPLSCSGIGSLEWLQEDKSITSAALLNDMKWRRWETYTTTCKQRCRPGEGCTRLPWSSSCLSQAMRCCQVPTPCFWALIYIARFGIYLGDGPFSLESVATLFKLPFKEFLPFIFSFDIGFLGRWLMCHSMMQRA